MYLEFGLPFYFWELTWVEFVYLNLFIFNWRIIALQYYIGYCHISTWMNHRCTYFPFLLTFPPTSHSILPPPAAPRPAPPRPTNREHQIWTASLGTGNSLQISVLYVVMHMFQCCSLSLSHPLLPPVSTNLFSYVCMSITPLKIGSSVPFF